MREDISTVRTGIITIGGVVNWAAAMMFGSWSDEITSLIVLMVIDYAAGIILAAFFHKSTKTKSGKLSSSAGIKGIGKKVISLGLVAVAHHLEMATNFTNLQSLVIGALMVNEVISIMENAGRAGVLPKRVQELLNKAIEFLNGKDDKGV